ncbi:hypothetical protein HAZT_HAZT000035 [Hyalella azteca]|uniref:Uncharacterized protein n=1 Tax=Hyalella azteca TaxID=294128 RepID=A0A6A0GVA1_HYAAZ|nr:hypothetical protein HAZT_HAZT000035 [Hyalella azteca]
MLLQSSSAVPMTSASWAEQHDSVGPLGFGNGEEYLRLLKEAQREGSNQSSALVSLSSSRRDSPRGSPKSPPNSPNTELTADGRLEQLGTVYINYYSKDSDAFVRVEKNTDTDWVWDWSSRPDQLPPKSGFNSPFVIFMVINGTASAAAGTSRKTRPASCARLPAVGCNLRRGASLRRLKVGESALFSRGVLYTLFLTNVLSFLLGTGIG